jgi:hypothetical protein
VDHPPESLTFRPAPSTWRALIHHNTSAQTTQLRHELDLPTDLPIIMSGHHPDFWHTGVLSKYLAADAASAALGAHPVWLFVDQDRADSIGLRYPARSNGTLTVGTATVRERKPPPTPRDAIDEVVPQLQFLLGTFARHTSVPDLSHQLASTLSDLIKPYTTVPHSNIFATTLSRTTLFKELVAQMAKDPERCITTYNAAAANHPTAGIRPLTASDIQDRWELPLWHLPEGKPRRHVYAEDLASIPPHELAPKALFMTGLMRLATCDLFIHGLGAAESNNPAHEGYDFITEEWFKTWLGVQIAPIALVTATRYLPLADGPIPTDADVALARWLAHHARHSPMLLRDPDAALAKQRCVDQLELLPRRSRTRADTFRRLHAFLETYRHDHAAELQLLESTANTTAARHAERGILFDRTWPFALFPDPALQALSTEIRAGFS